MERCPWRRRDERPASQPPAVLPLVTSADARGAINTCTCDSLIRLLDSFWRAVLTKKIETYIDKEVIKFSKAAEDNARRA
jgi:hypothetical protein